MVHGRHTFQPPTDHYDAQVQPLDEELCGIVQRRLDLTAERPSFPPEHLLTEWSAQFHLSLYQLQHVFTLVYRPLEPSEDSVEPKGFRRFVPLMRAVSEHGMLLMIPYMRQYDNASVVSVEIEIPVPEGSDLTFHFDLDIALTIDGHQCRNSRGQHHGGYFQHDFIVTPPLPDAGLGEYTTTVHIQESHVRDFPPAPSEIPKIPSATVVFPA